MQGTEPLGQAPGPWQGGNSLGDGRTVQALRGKGSPPRDTNNNLIVTRVSLSHNQYHTHKIICLSGLDDDLQAIIISGNHHLPRQAIVISPESPLVQHCAPLYVHARPGVAGYEEPLHWCRRLGHD
jgi:hypothetical protein